MLALILLINLLAQPAPQKSVSREDGRYSLYLNNELIGVLHTRKVVNGSIQLLTLQSETSITKLIRISVSESMHEEYCSNQLQKASQIRVVNGDQKPIHTAVRSKDEYHQTAGGKSTSSITESIEWSTLRLYFEEPQGQQIIYSSSHQQLLHLIYEGNGIYCLRQPGNKLTRYTYQQGQLLRVETQSMWGLIRFERNNSDSDDAAQSR